MYLLSRRRTVGVTLLTALLVASVFGILSVSGPADGSPHASLFGGSTLPVSLLPATPHTLNGTLFVATPPTNQSGPDDITMLSVPGFDHGRGVIYTEYQNGINPDGTPSHTGGPTQSTIAGYEVSTGKLVGLFYVKGHVDGVTADPSHDRICVTSNEDANSVFYLVYPASGRVVAFNYSPSLELSGNGGSDSIAIWHGAIYITHSNPNDTLQPASYRISLNWSAHSANTHPVFWDDSAARFEPAGTTGHLALTDPDTNYVMPSASPLYAGDLATISQADGRIIFAGASDSARGDGVDSPHHLTLTQLNVTDNVSSNVPPIDGLAVATSGEGTLYVVDAKGNTISAFVTDGWPAGTVFVGEPKDNGNPMIGTLNLHTGKITPFGNSFKSPKGLLFVPEHDHGFSEENSSHHTGENAWAPTLSALFARSNLPIAREL